VNGRRSLGIAIAVIAAGGLLVLLSSGRTWARATQPALAGNGHVALAVTGHQVAPSIPALGFALLTLAAAVLAARGRLRRVVGVIVVFIGATTIGVALKAPGQVSQALEHREVGAAGLAVHASANGWWVLTLIGGLLATVAGAVTVLRGNRWAALGARYDAPTTPPRVSDPAADAWAALDRGEDPTA
jgi:uncharacterized membrane protein (TIGR02234 family)